MRGGRTWVSPDDIGCMESASRIYGVGRFTESAVTWSRPRAFTESAVLRSRRLHGGGLARLRSRPFYGVGCYMESASRVSLVEKFSRDAVAPASGLCLWVPQTAQRITAVIRSPDSLQGRLNCELGLASVPRPPQAQTELACTVVVALR